MKSQTIRQWFAPALLAVAIAPLSLGALAASGDAGSNNDRKSWSAAHSEHRQALFERAGIDEQTRQALEDARSQHREATNVLRKEHRERMAELLDDDQRLALKKARKELHQEMRDERRQAMQQRMDEQLDAWELSEEKHQALSDIRESFYSDIQDLKDRKFDSRSERRKAWKDLRQAHYDAMLKVLNEEQLQELYQGMRESMRDTMASHGHHRKGHYGKGHHGDSWGE